MGGEGYWNNHLLWWTPIKNKRCAFLISQLRVWIGSDWPTFNEPRMNGVPTCTQVTRRNYSSETVAKAKASQKQQASRFAKRRVVCNESRDLTARNDVQEGGVVMSLCFSSAMEIVLAVDVVTFTKTSFQRRVFSLSDFHRQNSL